MGARFSGFTRLAPAEQQQALMHARELVELAAIAARHGALVASCPAPLPNDSLERYWSASKCRLDRWGRGLKLLGERAAEPATGDQALDHLGTLEEIITGDVLARVWAGVAVAHDRHTKGDAGAVVCSILDGQQERNRAMSLLINCPALPTAQARELDRLRRRAECWSDVLVGYLSRTEDLSQLAAEPARAQEFAADFRSAPAQTWSLLFASLQASVRTSFDAPSPNADLNGQIAGSVISCFEPALFDSTGLLRSLWMSRLQSATDETQGMIDSLFAAERDPPRRRGPGSDRISGGRKPR